MTHERLAFGFVVLGIALGCRGQHPKATPQEAYIAALQNKEAIVNRLRPLLKRAGRGARINYLGACQDAIPFLVPLPTIPPLAPRNSERIVDTVRALLGHDKNVVVTQEDSRIIRIEMGRVPTAILRTRIAVLALNPKEQYDPWLAIKAIEHSDEVRTAMKTLRVELPSFDDSKSFPCRSGDESPRLPSSMNNVTVDEALDVIAETFKGIVLYGACKQADGSNEFDIGFVCLDGH